MTLLRVPGTNLYRDTNNMAIINKDYNGLEEYNMKRKMIMTQKEELNIVKNEMDTIKNDVLEIKQLLLTLLEK